LEDRRDEGRKFVGAVEYLVLALIITDPACGASPPKLLILKDVAVAPIGLALVDQFRKLNDVGHLCDSGEG
jgi:hypothetical protein